MTIETFVIILAIIIGVTIVSTISQIFRPPTRDFAAQDRDRGLAKLLEARAEVLRTEARERRQALEETQRQRRDAACEEARHA